MTDVLMVFVTCDGRQQAETIASRVVEERLAACVNVLAGVRSCYVWEGKLTWSDEVLLVMKTTRSAFEKLKTRVVELHSYEVPEILGVPVEAGLDKYVEWVRGGTLNEKSE
jgi:uncharacterized protein involved in tolerance to divalent cations